MASGRLILPITEPILTSSGLPNVGATLTVYVTGTDTPAGLYADPGLSTPIANPQTSNAAGRFYDQATVIWADSSQAYDCTVDLTDGETLTYDEIYLLGAATNTSGFAPINSPAFTGTPTAPTPASNNNSNDLATTAYVQNQGYAALASPHLTGTPTAPTGTPGDNTTQIATDAFVTAALTAKAAAFATAWVTFQGSSSGGAQTILKSYNVASVTRSSMGLYAIVFSAALADGNYCPVLNGLFSGSSGGSVGIYSIANGTAPSATGFTLSCTNQTGSFFDPAVGTAVVFGT